MAGSNPQLAIRIAANTDELKRNLAEGRAAIEALGPSVAKMTATWNTNAAAVVQKANNITAALHGVSVGTLTASDAAKNLKALDIAMAQLRSSGAPVPALMQQTADKLRQVSGAAAGGVAPVQSLTSKLQGMAGTLGLAFGAAAVVSGLKSLISNTFTYAETIKDTSAKMGVSMQATQRWKFAAEQTGASLENVSKSVLKLSQGLAGGDKGLKEALATAGVQFESLRGMKPEDAFNTVAAAIAKIPDPMLQAKVALEAFGKGGAELLPALREGFVSLADGVATMSDDTINRLDDAKDAWAAFGRAVTIYSGEVVGAMMSVSRAFLSDWTTAAQIMKVAGEQGMAAAIAMALGIDKARNSIIELSGSSKMYALAASKAGDSVKEIAAALNLSEKNVQAYIDSLKKAGAGAGELTAEQQKALEAAKKLREEFQKKVDAWTGVAAQTELAALRKAIDAAGGVAKLSTGKYKELGATLSGLQQDGAFLGAEFRKIALNHDLLNSKIPVTMANYKLLADAMKLTTNIKLGSAPPPIDALPKVGYDVSGIVAQMRLSLAMAGKNPDIALTGAKVGKTFGVNFGAAIANLGSVIVGAIQGGGKVAASIFASIGAGLGADLGTSITNGMTKTLADGTKAVAGTFAKMIGGLAGPLGALAGNLLGGVFDKIFNNAGRAAAVKFSESFGGFDKLRQELNVLGDEGERLWIQLTQIAKGEREVAAATAAITAALAAFKVSPQGMAESTYQTREQLQLLANQAKATYDYMLASGLYTASELTKAWAAYKAAMGQLGGSGAPAGALGFPTRAQLQEAAKDAEETYRYIRDSGLYTAASVDQAFQQWQDSLIAAGDAGATALKKIDAEMKSLQDSIAMEAPEEVMGVIEAEQRARLKALEEEKAATLVKIEEELRAEEAAAVTAEASAQKAFDKTLVDARALDGEMRRIFSQGYDIPFRFQGMPGGGSGGAGNGGPQAHGGDYRVDKPTWFMAGEAGPERATFTPLRGGGGGGGGDQTIVVQVSEETLVRAVVRGAPRYVKLRSRAR